MLRFAGLALIGCLPTWANGQNASNSFSGIECREFRQHLVAAEEGSANPVAREALIYRNALSDAFSWYYGERNVEREFNRALNRCDTTLSDAVQAMSENIFYDFEDELRLQIEYENE